MTDTKRIEDLSDDELRDMTPEQFESLASQQPQDAPADEETGEASQEATQAEAGEQTHDDSADEAADAAKGDDHEDGNQAEESTEERGAENGSGDDPSKGESPEAKGEKPDAADDKAPAKVDDKAEEGDVNYKAQLDALYAPFKANGREMKVENVEEARQLMQMGANYNKKMQAMRPHLATLRTLENAGIGEKELGFLIDLHKRDAAAINKLVNESGIDPMDLSAEKAAGYTPGDHRAKDSEVQLDVVLDELKDSASFERTVDVVMKQFDGPSKRIVAENPELLKVLNAQIESGIYDQIMAQVDRDRTFGRLTGLSDLEAYRQVGDAMNERRMFAHQRAEASPAGQQAAPAPVITPPNPKKAEDENKRKEARRAVAPVRTTPSSGNVAVDYNPLSMSDEEFQKLGGKF